jgi:hypothetical protein
MHLIMNSFGFQHECWWRKKRVDIKPFSESMFVFHNVFISCSLYNPPWCLYRAEGVARMGERRSCIVAALVSASSRLSSSSYSPPSTFPCLLSSLWFGYRDWICLHCTLLFTSAWHGSPYIYHRLNFFEDINIIHLFSVLKCIYA